MIPSSCRHRLAPVGSPPLPLGDSDHSEIASAAPSSYSDWPPADWPPARFFAGSFRLDVGTHAIPPGLRFFTPSPCLFPALSPRSRVFVPRCLYTVALSPFRFPHSFLYAKSPCRVKLAMISCTARQGSIVIACQEKPKIKISKAKMHGEFALRPTQQKERREEC